MKTKKSQLKDTAKLKNIIFYIFAFVIFFMPLIVKLRVFSVPTYVSTYYPPEKTFDFFTYYKTMLLIAGTLILFPLVVYYRYKIGKKLEWNLVAQAHMLLAGAILVSSIFSQYKEVAFLGFFNKNEGALTWWAYLLLSYSVYLFVDSKAVVIKFLNVIVASTSTICIIGLFQFMGLDYINFDIFKRIVYGSYYEQLSASQVMIFGNHTVYSTLANPNFVGSLIGIAIPLIFTLMLEQRSKSARVSLGILMLLHLFILIISKSTSGLVAVSATAFIGLTYYSIKMNKIKYAVIGCCVFGIALLGFLKLGLAHDQVEKISEALDVNHEKINPFRSMQIEGTKLVIDDINKNQLIINHNDAFIWIENKYGEVEKMGLDGNGLMLESPQWTVSFDKKNNVLVVISKLKGDPAYAYRQVFVTPTGYTLVGTQLTSSNIISNKYTIFKNNAFLSWRGYIWNRSLPLVMESPLIGHGLDCFVLDFPQNDIREKPIFNQLTDKAHSAYIQLLYGIGAIGFLSFMVFITIGVKLNHIKSLYLPIISYLIAGLTTDSTVFIGMIFFVLMGLMFSTSKGEQL